MIGQTISHYDVIDKLGEGGMGVVYKAQDTRLDRTVALKFLAPHLLDDDEAKVRFLREAKAAAGLDHSNVCTVYEVGEAEGKTFLVMALIEGESLEARIAKGPLPLSEALDISRQVADGLEAAHEKGVSHRDIKPANIMLDSKGRATVMDFGLARLTEASRLTKTGQTLGTVPYMSPEQLQGAETDHRTDIWALGCVLYEMVAGARAFRGEYQQALAYEIVNEEPEPLTGVRAGVPMELEFIANKCLEKGPSARYSSAADLATDLRRVGRNLDSDGRSAVRKAAPTPAPMTRSSRTRVAIVALASAIALALLAAAFLAGSRLATLEPPVYTRLTFKRGLITGARFAPTGDEIIYSAAWDGGPLELFSTRPGAASSRPLGIGKVDILAISSTGEMALRERIRDQSADYGRLYTASLAGGPPRASLDGVLWADWTPEGRLAVVRAGDGKQRLEVPVGTPIYQFDGETMAMRIARDGRIAMAQRAWGFGRAWNLLTFDGETAPSVTKVPGAGSTVGLAWDPDGDGVWYEAGELGGDRISMLTPEGDHQIVQAIPGQMRLHDVSSDGRALISRSEARAGVRCLAPGESAEHELSFLDFSEVDDITSDGRTILMTEFGEAGGPNTWSVYLRNTDGSPPVRLSDGQALAQGLALSPDGKNALTFELTDPPQIVIWPTGAGEPLRLANSEFTAFGGGDWHPDGERVLFSASAGGGSRIYIQDLKGGAPTAVTPEGQPAKLGQRIISPDGNWILGKSGEFVYPTEGGEPRAITLPEGVTLGQGWSADSSSIFVIADEWGEPYRIYKIRLADGETTLWKELAHPDPTGMVQYWALNISADEQSYCYSYMRDLSALYLVEGLR